MLLRSKTGSDVTEDCSIMFEERLRVLGIPNVSYFRITVVIFSLWQMQIHRLDLTRICTRFKARLSAGLNHMAVGYHSTSAAEATRIYNSSD